MKDFAHLSIIKRGANLRFDENLLALILYCVTRDACALRMMAFYVILFICLLYIYVLYTGGMCTYV